MLVKFLGHSMSHYVGQDGKGGRLELKQGDVAEVSENVAKLLLMRYSQNFEAVLPESQKEEHAPDADKFYRKSRKTKTK